MSRSDELDLLRRSAPAVPPAGEAARIRARARLTQAADTASQAAAAAPRRTAWRYAAATGVAALVVAVVVGAIGPAPSGDAPADTVRPFGPAGAEAVVEAVEVDGYTEVRFLDPSADPARIEAELEELGIDLDVAFVAADPFSVGRMVYQEGAEGIELLGATGSELQGGPIGIRVPDGWSGDGALAIGRAAAGTESFETSIPLNAERPGGPLHCVAVRGLTPAEAAATVRDEGLDVEWRTMAADGSTSASQPPADFVVADVLWSAPETVMLFAEAGPLDPLPGDIQALIDEGCDGSGR